MTPSATRQSRLQEWRAGWHAVIAAGIGIAAGPAFYLYVSSLFVQPVEQAFSWSRSQMMTIAAIPLLGAFVAPIVGRLVDRYGIYKVAIPSLILLAIAFVGLSQARGHVLEVCLWMALLGIAVPGSSGLTLSRPVVGWFTHSRGLALGMMAALVTVFTAILAPPLGYLIANYGFRAGYLALGAMAVVIALPAVGFFLREKPSTPPEPAPSPITDDHDSDFAAAPLNVASPPPQGFGTVARRPDYWVLLLSIFLCNIPIGGMVTQLTPIVQARGISAVEAGGMLTLYALSAFTGRLIIGFLFDHFNAAAVAAVMCVVAIFGALALLPAAPQMALYFGVLTIGLMHGAEVDVGAFFVARMLPRSLFGTGMGGVSALGMLATAVGVVGFGQLYDRSGSYDSAIVGSAVLFFLSAVLYVMLIRSIRRGHHAQVA